MRKSFPLLILYASLGIGCLLAAWMRWGRGQADPREVRAFDTSDSGVAGRAFPGAAPNVAEGLQQSGPLHRVGVISVVYPPDGAVFPPEIASPVFRWEDGQFGVSTWRIGVEFEDNGPPVSCSTEVPRWQPSDEQWETIKKRSCEKRARVTIEGIGEGILSTASVSISTSRDAVGAPLFFREVNLPFLTAVKDPAAHIRWRFGEISSKGPPPIVMEKLPVCGNCHSFSADGKTLAMEVDSGNDKGAYAIAPVQEEIVLDPTKLITWSEYRREDNEKTFGLLCQASPDGRYVVGTVKDRALAVYRPDLAFSQLFFLVKGILAIYDRQTDAIRALPGADDPGHVQTNGTWSPDGKFIVFARSRSPAYDPPSLRQHATVLVPQREADEFLKGGRTFQYDLYRIPFNGGKGGKAEPLAGASNNGMSNYFAKFSPDGKWIVFCKAKSFMLLQPDSGLWIVPAEGGEARRLRCNTGRMNSWHSWSPNGKWLVFSSKAYSIYTQLLLTHIDEQGECTPAVVLENFTEKDRAANIPEFANVRPGAIRKIREAFLDDTNYLRAGDEFRKQGEYENAIRWYRRAVDINPKNAAVHVNWGTSALALGKIEEAKDRFSQAIRLSPDLPEAHCGLGMVLRQQNKRPAAVDAYREAVRRNPNFAVARLHLGALLLELGHFDRAEEHLLEAVRLSPKDPFAHFNLGAAYARQDKLKQAVAHFTQAIERQDDFVPALVGLALIRAVGKDTSLRDAPQAARLAARACELSGRANPEALYALAAAYAELGRYAEATTTAETAIRAATATNNRGLIETLKRLIETCRQQTLPPLE